MATNEIAWDDVHINAETTTDRLFALGLEVGIRNLTIIVHACFSAGTVERPPTAARNTQTFAGQLCSDMKRYYYPGLRVIGYQGQTKVGHAGVPVGRRPSLRGTRSTPSIYKAEFWQVVYGGAGDRDGFAEQGARVTWS